MNCAACPHMARIKEALRPCQKCEAGKLHGQCHIDSQSADWAYAQRKMDDHTPSAGVTNLHPDDEDTLRRAMASLFALDPIELLLVQHVMRGGSYASFAAPLYRICKRLRTKEPELTGAKPGFRQLAKTWADALAEKMPTIAPVLKARIDQNGAIAQDARKRP